MTTHPDTCPMREGDSKRRWLVRFVGGPLDDLVAWLPRSEWDVLSRWGQFLAMLHMRTEGGVSWWGIPDRSKQRCPALLACYHAHLYRVTGAHRVDHVGRAS